MISNCVKKVTVLLGVGLALAMPSWAATPTYPVIVKDTSAVYWQTVYQGAQAAAKKLGVNVTILGTTSEMDVQGQISIMENAAASNPPAIILAATDKNALVKVIDNTAKKMPVIMVDSNAETDKSTCYIATDNEASGRLAAKTLAELIKKKDGAAKGKVAVITGQIGASSLDLRSKGFMAEMKEHYPDITIITDPPRDARSDLMTALGIMNDLLVSTPDLKGVFCNSEFTAAAAGQALSESPRKKDVILVGFDNNPQVINFVKSGIISAVMLQNPFKMGYMGVEFAVKAAKGEKVDKLIDTGIFVLTKDNVDTQEAKDLYAPGGEK